MRRSPSGPAVLLVLMLAGGFGLWIGAQYIAWRFAFHPNLGTPAYSWAGVPIYSPLRYLVWLHAFSPIPALSGVLRESAFAVGVGAVGMLAPLVLLLRSRPVETLDSHGSARWGHARATLSASGGLIVGREGRHLLRHDGRGEPVVTIAPTGAGKGVSVVIPNLLDYLGSVLATDPKGELAAVTARRRREMGQRVHVLDPWGLAGGTAGYNPLDGIDVEGDDAVDDARLLAQMLVVERGGDEGGYWNAEAREVLTALILHVASTAPPERRNLPYVRDLLTLPPEDFEELLAEMRDNEAVAGLVARSAASLQDRSVRSPKEYLGVLNTARSHTHFLASPRMARVLGRSTFDPAELRQGRTSVYLVLPADRLDTYAAWMRLVIATTLTSLWRGGERLTDVIRNSSAFGAWYDVGVVLARKGETSPVSVRVELRDHPSAEPFAFMVEDQFPAGPEQGVVPGGWLRLQVGDFSPERAQREAAATILRPAVLDYLRSHPGCSKNQLEAGIGGDRTVTRAALEALCQEGFARCDAPEGRGRRSRCWLLGPSSLDLAATSLAANPEDLAGFAASPRRGVRTANPSERPAQGSPKTGELGRAAGWEEIG